MVVCYTILNHNTYKEVIIIMKLKAYWHLYENNLFNDTIFLRCINEDMYYKSVCCINTSKNQCYCRNVRQLNYILIFDWPYSSKERLFWIKIWIHNLLNAYYLVLSHFLKEHFLCDRTHWSSCVHKSIKKNLDSTLVSLTHEIPILVYLKQFPNSLKYSEEPHVKVLNVEKVI